MENNEKSRCIRLWLSILGQLVGKGKSLKGSLKGKSLKIPFGLLKWEAVYANIPLLHFL